MSFKITVVAEQTGDEDSIRIGEGDYSLLCHPPCYLDGVQTYPGKGTVVLTIKDHRPQPPPELPGETP